MYAHVNKHSRKTIVHHLADLDNLLNESDTHLLNSLPPLVNTLFELYPELSQDLSSVLDDHQRGATEEARSKLTALRKRVAAPSCKQSQLHRDMSDDLRQQIISTLQAGDTPLTQVCKHFGLTETTLRHLRHEAGLPIQRHQHLTSFTDNELREAMLSISSQKELSELFGVHPAAISHRIRFL